ncbi:hypothetical protein [Sphingobacterium sp.]|uniref:hypothetical protein n=1 Tax=Sphingobacterium sp. TaxID=341027 RepID=UPI00289E2534|nr:hypothetical protein [Sphingobacterium sp.]
MNITQNLYGAKTTVALTGIYRVKVAFEPNSFTATLASYILKPDGDHHIKLSDAGSGITKIEFSDASGNTSGFESGSPPSSYGDFAYATTKHYWKNSMPLALAFQDVTFKFDQVTGEITNGNGVHAIGRRNGNGSIPPFINANQNSNNSAAIITTKGNSASAFSIRIKLGFELDFSLLLTKI